MVLSETSTPQGFRLRLSQVMPGGIQLCIVLWRTASLLRRAAHGTQRHVILPPNLFSISWPLLKWRPLVWRRSPRSRRHAAFFMILPSSKPSPLFHTAKVTAESFRATARRAISGRIPPRSSPA